jgi:hypothetical protein
MLLNSTRISLSKKDGGSLLMSSGNISSFLTLIVTLTEEYLLMEKKQELGMPDKATCQECLPLSLHLSNLTHSQLTTGVIVELRVFPTNQ